MLENNEDLLPTFVPFPLSPLDHLLPRLHMTFFTFFATRTPIKDVEILEAGIKALLTHYPVLCGDVCSSSESDGKANRVEMHPPTSASLKMHPLVQRHVHAGKYFYRPKSIRSQRVSGNDLFHANYQPVPLNAVDQARAPGLRWQANIFEDGIIVGICYHHMFVDAMGTYQILRALAALCRNAESPRQTSLQPVGPISREWIIGLEEQDHSTPGTRNVDIFYGPPKALDVTGDKNASQLITIPHETIGRLKESCMAFTRDLVKSVRQENDSRSTARSQHDYVLSDNDVAAALMWLCWMRSHGCQHSTNPPLCETSIVMMIDLRHLSRGMIYPNYIGNALTPVSASAPLSCPIGFPVQTTIATVCRQKAPVKPRLHPGISAYHLALLADLAHRVHTRTAVVDNEYLLSLIREKQSSSDWRSGYPKKGQFCFSNMRLLDLADMDFGRSLGKIVKFDIPDFRTNGQCWVLPTPMKMAPWEFRLSMEKEHMQRFLKDPLLTWAIGTEVARL